MRWTRPPPRRSSTPSRTTIDQKVAGEEIARVEVGGPAADNRSRRDVKGEPQADGAR